MAVGKKKEKTVVFTRISQSSLADPGFGHFLAKTCIKMKEIGPINRSVSFLQDPLPKDQLFVSFLGLLKLNMIFFSANPSLIIDITLANKLQDMIQAVCYSDLSKQRPHFMIVVVLTIF